MGKCLGFQLIALTNHSESQESLQVRRALDSYYIHSLIPLLSGSPYRMITGFGWPVIRTQLSKDSLGSPVLSFPSLVTLFDSVLPLTLLSASHPAVISDA